MSDDEKPVGTDSEDAVPAEHEEVTTTDAEAEGGEAAEGDAADNPAAEGDDGALLSNEEIDALLEDVDSDDVGDAPVGPARVVDLADRGGSAFKMAGLDRVNNKFILTLRQSLYAFLRHRVDITFDGSTCPTLDEYLRSCTEPTSFNAMRLEPLPGVGSVVLPSDLLFRVVDTLFGGSGAVARGEAMAEFTPTELRVAHSLVDVTLAEYVRAWGEVLTINAAFSGQESDPKMVVICERSERVVVSRFTIALEGSGSGQFDILMPLAMLEPVRDALASDIQDDTDFDASPGWASDFQRELMGAEAQIVARLGTVDTTVRKLGNLQVGDVLAINEPDHVDLLVEGALFLQGRYGETRGNVAVRIDTVADRVLELNPTEPTRLDLSTDSN